MDGAEATYLDALPDTDVQLTATLNGIQEILVLHSAAAPSVFTFPLQPTGVADREVRGRRWSSSMPPARLNSPSRTV